MNNYAEEYITKATAQEVVKDVFRVDTITQEIIDTCMKCMTAIKNAPSADVRENVRGEWQVTENIENDCYIVRCSNCHASVRVGSRILYDTKIELNNYCPSCGADMRGNQS